MEFKLNDRVIYTGTMSPSLRRFHGKVIKLCGYSLEEKQSVAVKFDETIPYIGGYVNSTTVTGLLSENLSYEKPKGWISKKQFKNEI